MLSGEVADSLLGQVLELRPLIGQRREHVVGGCPIEALEREFLVPTIVDAKGNEVVLDNA